MEVLQLKSFSAYQARQYMAEGIKPYLNLILGEYAPRFHVSRPHDAEYLEVRWWVNSGDPQNTDRHRVKVLLTDRGDGAIIVQLREDNTAENVRHNFARDVVWRALDPYMYVERM